MNRVNIGFGVVSRVFEVWVCCGHLLVGWVHIFVPFHMIKSALDGKIGCKDVIRRESGF